VAALTPFAQKSAKALASAARVGSRCHCRRVRVRVKCREFLFFASLRCFLVVVCGWVPGNCLVGAQAAVGVGSG
jgi:hypothetical protein